ncbi:MAG: RNA-guided endonuclease InsQ/TnpB family protein [Candidatus Hodarchaeales archaeon]|jgi:putative transposase
MGMRAKKQTTPQLTIRIQMKSRPIFMDLCTRAKNLYNSATYQVRKEFFATGKWLQYTTLYDQLKHEPVYLALKEISDSYLPQQVLRQVEQTWRSYFNALKVWKKNFTKFLGRPRFPGYKAKNGLHMLSFPKPRVRIRGAEILFARNLMARGFPKFPVGNLPITAETCSGARLVPFYDRFVIELLYETQGQSFSLNNEHSPKAIGIDLGLTNLVATSDGLLVKGGVVKTINQWYNKQLAYYKSLAKKHSQQHTTKRMQRMNRVRTNKINNCFHQTSREIIDHCLQNNINTLVVGYNPLWKQHCQLGKRINQSFVQVPFHKFLHMLEYKAKLVGIAVILVSEAYTSQKCSSCGIINKKNRRSRGLYHCYSCGLRLNADHNTALNILQRLPVDEKVVPKVNSNLVCSDLPDRGCVTHPVVTQKT